ncbi:Alpha/Beta hydrolase protein [Infundibulicybe gibba]|nr:Alpha/Beta hydrolase protein [Infundibulicybe gibba]
MLYDSNPPYSHYAHLPYAKEPWKSFYVTQRLITTLLLIVVVNFTRRIFKVTEVAGWVEPLPKPLRSGVVVDARVPFRRVGCYIWPQEHVPITGDSVVGMFMHGGGYCHMSAQESSRTSRIPRRLIQNKIMTQIYSVEYRLLQHAPFPAVVQDASAVYAHLCELLPPKTKIILIGDSSGGNLVLALARWIRDEGVMRVPDGLLLLSPSCDTSHALPDTLSANIPRPNAQTDYLVDTIEPRRLLQRTFLGFQHHSPSSMPLSDEERKAEEELLQQVVHSEYVSPCSPVVLHRWGHEIEQDIEGAAGVILNPPHNSTRAESAPASGAQIPSNGAPADTHPTREPTRFATLFGAFPRTLIVVGDAERLVREVRSLEWAMRRDGVDVTVEWVEDAVHDLLIFGEGGLSGMSGASLRAGFLVFEADLESKPNRCNGADCSPDI